MLLAWTIAFLKEALLILFDIDILVTLPEAPAS